jgi:tetratricopeptide (TPR) repeat protein
VLIQKLTTVIESDPENEVLYYKRGLLYENMKNEQMAAADYKKAVEINADYYDAVYALGKLYFNDGASIANASKDLKTDADFEAAKKKYEAKFKEAEPFWRRL